MLPRGASSLGVQGYRLAVRDGALRGLVEDPFCIPNAELMSHGEQLETFENLETSRDRRKTRETSI